MTYKALYAAFRENRKVPAANVPKEVFFQKKILEYLRVKPDCFVWKEAVGYYSQGGLPDICCIYKGRFYGFEVKRPFGLGRLSALQKQTLEKIRQSGGVAEVVSFVEEVQEILEREC